MLGALTKAFVYRYKHQFFHFVILMSVLLVGCSSGEQTTPTEVEIQQPSAKTMRLAIDLWPGYYPAVIAHEKGWFKEAGLDLILELPRNTDKLLARFSAGTIDAVGIAFGDAVLVSRQMPDVAVILITDESHGGDAVLSMNPDILQHLNGTRIGTYLGGFGELLIRRMLNEQGLDVEDVELVNVDQAKVPELLEQGKLDLAHTWNPYIRQALSRGAHVVYSSADTPGLIPDTISITGEYRESNPEAIKTFVDVWFKAQKWWFENYEQGNKLIAKATDQEPSEISLDGIKLLGRKENISVLSDTESSRGLPNVLNVYNEFYSLTGVIRVPASPTMIASEFLQ